MSRKMSSNGCRVRFSKLGTHSLVYSSCPQHGTTIDATPTGVATERGRSCVTCSAAAPAFPGRAPVTIWSKLIACYSKTTLYVPRFSSGARLARRMAHLPPDNSAIPREIR
jgi:hypothetical protein